MDENQPPHILTSDPDEITGVYRRTPTDGGELPPRQFARGTTGPAVRSNRSIVMTDDALEAHAEHWYRQGIAATGEGFHGEGLLKDAACWSLLYAYFRKLWADRGRPRP